MSKKALVYLEIDNTYNLPYGCIIGKTKKTSKNLFVMKWVRLVPVYEKGVILCFKKQCQQSIFKIIKRSKNNNLYIVELSNGRK